MSRIFKEWKCVHCGTSFQYYVSFGHPDDDFIFKWKCRECGKANELLVKAMPRDESYYWYNPAAREFDESKVGIWIMVAVGVPVVLTLLFWGIMVT